MAKWLDVADLNPPFDSGVLDGNSRAVYIFNVLAYKVPSLTLEAEVVKILEDAGVGTDGVNIFHSSKAVIPSGAGPYLNFNITGGVGGVRIHNDITGPAYERPSIQFFARANSSSAAEGMARAAFAAMVAVKNRDVVP